MSAHCRVVDSFYISLTGSSSLNSSRQNIAKSKVKLVFPPLPDSFPLLLPIEDFSRQRHHLRAHLMKTLRLHTQPVSPPSTVSPSVPLLNTFSASLPPSVSVKSGSSIQPRDSHPLKTPSEPLWETDSTDSGVSMKSDSSMSDPPNFNLHRKQSCAVCEEAVKDPILLPCGHWSCTECSHSFWDEYGLTADDPCKKCGRRSEREKRDQDLRSVLLEKTIKRVETETEKLQAEKETFQAEKEKFQAEKEKFQAEKEKFELEKRKLALEIQSLELNGKCTNYDQGVVYPKIRIPYF